MGSGLPVSLSPDASAVDMDLYEAQTLADALKWYLQELPTPLIPPALYSDLVHMAQGKHTWAVPIPQTSVGLEKLWEAPKKTSQHLQLALTPSPAQCCTKADFTKHHWEHHLCRSSTASFGRCSGKGGRFRGLLCPHHSMVFSLCSAWRRRCCLPGRAAAKAG